MIVLAAFLLIATFFSCNAFQGQQFAFWLQNLRPTYHRNALCGSLTGSKQLIGVEEPRDAKAFPQQTPHSGRHFVPSHPAYRKPWWNRRFWSRVRRRFMEGWYYRLTIPEQSVSFAFILSIEDPGRRPPSDIRLACIQVVGPHDEYLVQADRDDTLLWAWKRQQGVGCTFAFKDGVDEKHMLQFTALQRDVWLRSVESGFHILPTAFLGRVNGHDGARGVLPGQGVPGYCEFDFVIEPICGWGGSDDARQKSTGGWLSSFAVFEPHWQVTLADARASGSVTWKNTTYSFRNAPFYAEKNWGAALPSKWYWTQCNSFDGFSQLAVTAGGGIRKLPFGQQEALGMVCVHYDGKLYEAVPWTGSMSWEVQPWGSWKLRGNSTSCDHPFEVEVIYECDPSTCPGLVFRAPTPDQGMIRFCRDTFEAQTTLTLWELEWKEERGRFERHSGPPLIDNATSFQGGAEVGGGPWWDVWEGDSNVKQPFRALLRLPSRIRGLKSRIKRIK